MSDHGDPLERKLTREQLLRRAAVGGALIASSGTLAGAAEAAMRAAAPKRGGNFRVGVSGGSAKDIIDGQDIITQPDQARLVAGWETLVTFDSNFKLVFDGLADEVSPMAGRPDIWTIRVRQGIEFQNGKTLGADDVIYSLQRMVDPKLGLFGGAALSSVDPKRIKKIDKLTCRLFLKRKDVTILDALGQYVAGIVPVGYSRHAIGKANPNVGTGPYTLKSFTPGQQSVHVRNPNYWRSGQPYFDQITIIDFPDDTARVNALLGGQIDAAASVPPAQVTVISSHSGTKVLESPTAQWTPICMRVDVAPFNDVRVRQAMRLIADRPQMVTQALAGHGHIGNDVYAPFDEAYDRALPQRVQDIDKAKSLLAAAGQSGLTVDLQSTNGALGMNEGAQVFAQQASAAGVKVNVKILDGGTFYGPQYLKWPFSTDFWGTRNYLSQVAAGSLPTSPYNETHWPDGADKKFLSLYTQALQTVDRTKRFAIEHEMQQLEYDNGGYVIWGFSDFLDGYSTKLAGLKAGDKGVLPLNGFGNGYRTIWFA
ncbi:MAG TPA: ABC transporter substrate-binding protein [Gaiellaceae bacterium]|nr:ABC transporter substrate-binding protein [Gaiellaceae bacterium]HXY81793.1 ABC transporter substrate-binding protein [Gaiellaceae bacterium]